MDRHAMILWRLGDCTSLDEKKLENMSMLKASGNTISVGPPSQEKSR